MKELLIFLLVLSCIENIANQSKTSTLKLIRIPILKSNKNIPKNVSKKTSRSTSRLTSKPTSKSTSR